MNRFLIFLFLLSAVLSVGCGRSAPTRYYLLESGVTPANLDSMPTKTLRVAQVETPGYLNRNNIVSRVNGESQLILAEFHLWAEPVGAGFRRVIEETIIEPLYKSGIAVLPSATENRGDYTLLIDVQRLDGNFNEKAVLESWWTLLDRNDNTVERGLYAAEEMVHGANYNVLAAAESRLVSGFGKYLAGRLPGLTGTTSRKSVR